MDPDVWYGVLFAVLIGGLHGGLGWLINRWGLGVSRSSFVAVVLGGAAFRLFLALILVVLVIWYAPINRTAFLVGLIGVFAVTLGAEVMHVHRLAGGDSPTSAADDQTE